MPVLPGLHACTLQVTLSRLTDIALGAWLAPELWVIERVTDSVPSVRFVPLAGQRIGAGLAAEIHRVNAQQRKAGHQRSRLVEVTAERSGQ